MNREEFERIERYLQDSMTPEEKSSFEKEMNSDENLSKAVADQNELQLAIEVGALNETLEEIHETHFLENTTTQNNWFAIAAGFAVLLVFGIWFAFQDSPTESLFAEYATQEPGMPVPMSSTEQYNFYDAMVDYKAEKFETAISKWSILLDKVPDSDTLNYYIGSAYFNLEQFEKAIPHYASTQSTGESIFNDKAQWYMVLCYLRTENETAIKAIEPHTNSEFGDDIKAIQNAL